MTVTAVQVCNQSLGLLGAKPITSLSGTDARSVLCNALYETIRDEVLSVREWAFATKWRTLSPSSEPPGNPRYTTKYPRHADQLRVLEACSEDGETSLDWVPEGADVITDGEEATSPTTLYTPTAIVAHAQAAYAGYKTAAIWALAGTCTGPHHVLMHWASAWDTMSEAYVRGAFCISVDDVLYFIDSDEFLAAAVVDLGDEGVTPLDGLTLQLVGEAAPSPFTPMFFISWSWDLGTPRQAGEGLLYTRALEKITDPTLWPPYFTAAMVVRLAAALAVPLSESAERQQTLEQLYRMRLKEAAAVDGMQGRSVARRATTLSDKRSL